MTAFRVCLVVIWMVVTCYTAVVIANHGLGLLTVFFGDIGGVGWPGQFNLDFLFMLMLSALWVAWRNSFSLVGFGLGLLALFGGSLFLSTYLFILTYSAGGNVKQVLLGEEQGSP